MEAYEKANAIKLRDTAARSPRPTATGPTEGVAVKQEPDSTPEVRRLGCVWLQPIEEGDVILPVLGQLLLHEPGPEPLR